MASKSAPPLAIQRKRTWSEWLRVNSSAIIRHAVLTVFCVITIFPFIWVVGMSLKSVQEAYKIPIDLLPPHPSLDAYSYAFNHIPNLPTYFENSVICTTSALAGVLVVSCLAGFAFVWLTFPFKKLIFGALVSTMFFPTQITSLIGIYQVNDLFNLNNTLLGLILPYIAINLVVSTYIMSGVFQAVPRELQDAARIDGCSALRTFLQIMLPLARNGVVVIFMLNFIAIWGEYLLVSVIINDDSLRTLTFAMASATAGVGAWDWPQIAAIYMVMIAPPVVLFAFLQRWFMAGLTEGAVKH
jgi:ABC-type glycerol-3-phosphate transport system permease component